MAQPPPEIPQRPVAMNELAERPSNITRTGTAQDFVQYIVPYKGREAFRNIRDMGIVAHTAHGPGVVQSVEWIPLPSKRMPTGIVTVAVPGHGDGLFKGYDQITLSFKV